MITVAELIARRDPLRDRLVAAGEPAESATAHAALWVRKGWSVEDVDRTVAYISLSNAAIRDQQQRDGEDRAEAIRECGRRTQHAAAPTEYPFGRYRGYSRTLCAGCGILLSEHDSTD